MSVAPLAEYSTEEFAFGLARWVESLLQPTALAPVEHPRAVLLGGQSGAGKTRLHGIFRDEFDSNVVVINGDEYRKSHPRFDLLQQAYGDQAVERTAAWSGNMTEALIDALSKLSYNQIIEGTLRTSAVPMKTANLLRDRGYGVSLALMAVKPEISLISCQIRYEEMRLAGTTPRATDPEHHKRIVDEIVGNLGTLESSELFDEIFLYTRTGERIYPVEGRAAAEVLQERLFGNWSAEEQQHYRHLQSRLARLQQRR